MTPRPSTAGGAGAFAMHTHARIIAFPTGVHTVAKSPAAVCLRVWESGVLYIQWRFEHKLCNRVSAYGRWRYGYASHADDVAHAGTGAD
jgi:hypothetical protein